ncbi:MAG: hypothetical protein HGA24_10140 [Candidatus Aminicenantes bacterium]|nr:hypothetical protein [Candidatus Aminicenantes bacterium]
MAYPGALDLQALAKLNDIDPAGEDALAFRSRAIDADGDGRPDLYLVDHNGDGSVDAVVRAVDSDGDGVNDTFVQYGEEGEVESIGRVNPATGELDVIYEEPDAIDQLLGSLGLVDLETPEEALFTSFEDPYIFETYGSYGDEVPEVFAEPEPLEAQDLRVTEMSEEDAAALEAGVPADEAGAEGAGTEAPPEVVPKIVEIEDRSGGAGSSLWAKVDQDGDGLADTDAQLGKTSTGTYYGDINKDGYSEDVATDLDLDGRIDTVDTSGRGSSSDTVGAERIVDPGSAHLVDGGPGDAEDDDASAVGGGSGESVASGVEYDAGDDDVGDNGPTTSGGSADLGGSVLDDSGSDGGYDSGSSSSGGDDTV